MFITKLQVVNACLSTMGDSGLTDLLEDHPFKGIALQCLDEELDRIAARGWWFNQEYVQLQPDAISKFIYVPNDVYSVITPARGFRVTQLGRRMYNASAQTYEWTCPLPARLTRKFPFEDLPFQAQAAIRDSAVFLFQGRFDADRETKNDCMNRARMSGEELIRIDAQNQKFNFLYRNGMEHNAWIAVTQDRVSPVEIVGPNIKMLG